LSVTALSGCESRVIISTDRPIKMFSDREKNEIGFIRGDSPGAPDMSSSEFWLQNQEPYDNVYSAPLSLVEGKPIYLVFDTPLIAQFVSKPS